METYKKIKIAYVAETSLNNNSAYSHHVIKMCDALNKKNNLTLFLPEIKNYSGFKFIKKKFLLTSKNKFNIEPIINLKVSNVFLRIFFSLRTSIKLKKDKHDLIITRSILTSFFLTIFKIFHYLEIHSDFKGLTKFLMIKLNYLNSNYIYKIIFISNSLKKRFYIRERKKILILHDAVDVKNFPKKKINSKIKNLTYIGSFHRGKGVELIIELAKKFQNLNFHLYGDTLNKKYDVTKNLKLYGQINYNKVPKKLIDSEILLLPSAKIQHGRSKNVNISNYNSPLKMFDYLAAGRVIVSSNRRGILEVLKHNYNSIIVNGFSVKDWEKTIQKILKKKYDISQICSNSLKTAKKFTWDKRAKLIINSFTTFKT